MVTKQKLRTDDHVVDNTRNLVSLDELVSGFRCYYCDQKVYIDTFPVTNELENNGQLFWIFRNIDYRNWSDIDTGASTLVLRGSSDLESAASQIIHKLKDDTTIDLVLHFSYSTTEHIRPSQIMRNHPCDWRHLSCVWTLLIQSINGYTPSQQEFLLKEFVHYTLRPVEENKYLENLWYALAQALMKSGEFDTHCTEPDRQNPPVVKRKLAVIFDLDNLPISTYELLIEIIRGTVRRLRRDFSGVKILIINPPISGDLLLDESEILIEYDKERQG
jgi:hypothetical protein